ncbi:unnamed protein product [Musa banksii]
MQSRSKFPSERSTSPSTPHVILAPSITTAISTEGNIILCVLYCSYRYKYSHRFPPRRACNRNSSSWKGVLPYRCLQMGKVVKEGPWGANAGNAFDTGRVDRFTKVKIYQGDVIYGLKITFVVDGKTQPPCLLEAKSAHPKRLPSTRTNTSFPSRDTSNQCWETTFS